jgi:hypothetical protein
MGVFVVLVVCLPLLCWHCDRHENIVGKYRAVDQSPPAGVPATLELQANGKGIWSIETDNAPFRWALHQKFIRLHTQAGGILEGVIDGERIRIDMPGTGVIVFERLE